MYNIAICDDDLEFIYYIEKMLLNAGLTRNIVMFHEYDSGVNFLNDLDKFTTIDLLIVDIQMPILNGNEIAKKFRESFPLSLIVFCSGVFLPSVLSIESMPFRFLLKDYTDKRMIKELLAVVNKMQHTKIEPFILATWHYNGIKLSPSEILYIEKGRNCCRIHITPSIKKYDFEDNLICKAKLLEIYVLLKDYGFEYAHDSYIVNLQYIKCFRNTELELIDGTMLTISRSKKEQFRLSFFNWVENNI